MTERQSVLPLPFPATDAEIADLLLGRRPRRNDDPPYMTPREVAKLARVDRGTVYRWLKTGRLTAIRPNGVGPGRPIRIRSADVRAILDDLVED